MTISNGIIGFVETKIIPSDSTCKITETLNFFNFNFNNNDSKFSSLAYRCINNIAVLDKSDAKEVCLFSFKKHSFVDRVFTLMLVYRKRSIRTQKFFQVLLHLLETNSIDIMVGDCNYDL